MKKKGTNFHINSDVGSFGIDKGDFCLKVKLLLKVVKVKQIPFDTKVLKLIRYALIQHKWMIISDRKITATVPLKTLCAEGCNCTPLTAAML